MEEPVPNATLSSTDIPIGVNEITEMASTKNKIVSSSLQYPKTKEKQETTVQCTSDHTPPLQNYSTMKQISLFQNNTDISDQINSNPVRLRALSMADYKLQEIIEDLRVNPVEEDEEEAAAAFKEEPFEDKNQSVILTGRFKWISQSRRFLRRVTEQSAFHYAIIVLVIIDLVIVFIELILGQLSAACLTEEEMAKYNITEQRDSCLLPPSHSVETGELALFYISFIIICIFVLEIFTSFYAFGWRRYKKILFLLDAIIVLASFIMEVYFHFGSAVKAGRASGALVVLRMWKVVRAIHAIAHSISLRNHLVMEKVKGAHRILQQEIIQAEKIIYHQNIKINDLNNLLSKNYKRNTPQPVRQCNEIETKDFNSVNYF